MKNIMKKLLTNGYWRGIIYCRIKSGFVKCAFAPPALARLI